VHFHDSGIKLIWQFLLLEFPGIPEREFQVAMDRLSDCLI